MPRLGSPTAAKALARPQPRQRFTPTRAVPRTVRTAAYLEIGVATFSVIMLVVSVVSFDWNAYVAQWVGPFEHDGKEFEVTPAAAVATAVTGVALGALGSVLTLIFALRGLRGANWARIGLSVMIALSAISLFTTPSGFRALGTGLLDLTAGILLWLPTSNEFFRLAKLDRATHRSKQLT